MVAAESIRARAVEPECVGRAAAPWWWQMGENVLDFLPKGPIEASRSLERGDKILELFATGTLRRYMHGRYSVRTSVLPTLRSPFAPPLDRFPLF